MLRGDAEAGVWVFGNRLRVYEPGVQELCSAPHSKENKHYWNEDQLAVCFTDGIDKASAEVVLLLTDPGLCGRNSK